MDSQKVPTLYSKLEKDGVQFIRLGNEVKLVLPSKSLFIEGTSRLKSTAYVILGDLVEYLNQQVNQGLEIKAYTPIRGGCLPNTLLSRQQAQRVAAYLLAQGLDTRLIVAKSEFDGFSRQFNSATDSFSSELTPLSSIEIRFRLKSTD